MKSRYQLHLSRWARGCGSEICPREDGDGASQVVLCRGTVPCHVLMVGEAPGRNEDTLGQPFVGPAGILLDRIVSAATGHIPQLRVAFTNIVGCMPISEDGQKTGKVPEDAIECCSARLQEMVKIANPALLVTVGKLSKDHLTPGYSFSIDVGDMPRVDLDHPAYILRCNEAQQGLLIQRSIVVLRNAVEEHVLKEG